MRLILGGFLGLVGSTPVVPTDVAYEFGWQSAPGCPDEATVAALVAGYLRDVDVAAHGHPPVKLRAHVSRESELFIARLTGDLPERVFSNEDCQALAQVTAFSAASQIEDLIRGRPADTVDVGPENVVMTAVAAPPSLVRAPVRRRGQLRGALRFAAGLAANDIPGAAALLRLTGALLWPRVRLELEASYVPRRAARFETELSQGLDLQMAAGGLRGCPTVRRRIELLVCAGAEVGAIHGRVVGGRAAGAAGFFAVNLGLAILYSLHPRVAVGALVEGTYRVERSTLEILHLKETGEVDAYPLTQKPESVRILAGVEMRFP